MQMTEEIEQKLKKKNHIFLLIF